MALSGSSGSAHNLPPAGAQVQDALLDAASAILRDDSSHAANPGSAAASPSTEAGPREIGGESKPEDVARQRRSC